MMFAPSAQSRGLQEEKILLQRQCATDSLVAPGFASDAEAEIPTIVLQPELAIQTLDAFKLCPASDDSCCLDLPVLKAANVDSCTSSETILFGRDEHNNKSKKRSRAAYASATVMKNSEEEALGMGLKKTGGVLEVSSLRTGCLLSSAPFQVGDRLVSINNIDCSKRALSTVATMLKKATGILTVVVERLEGDPNLVESMIMKETPASKTGLGVAPGTGHQIKISSINPKGMFSSSLLSRRDIILAINGTFCDELRDANEAAALIINAKQIVTVLAERRPDNAAVVAQAA